MYTMIMWSSTDRLSEDGALSVYKDHLDCGIILKNLHQLEELSLTFGYVQSPTFNSLYPPMLCLILHYIRNTKV